MDIESAESLNRAILAAMHRYADRTCFRIKQFDHYQNISYRRFQTLAFRLAQYFIEQGVTQGERVALIADNSLEWMVVYIACQLTGGVAVPLRTTLPPNTVHALLQDCSPRLVLIKDAEQAHALQAAGDSLPDLRFMVANNISTSEPDIILLSTILNRTLDGTSFDTIRTYAENVSPQALAVIHYVELEIEQPKGALFTQAQRWLTMQHLAQWLTFSPDDVAFNILPWEIFSSLDFAIHQFISGIPNVLVENRAMALENMQQTSPTLMQLTPFTLDSFYHEIMQDVETQPEASQEIFRWALAISKEYKAAGPDAPKQLREEYERADMTFFSQIRGRIGGRMRRLYSVKATLPQYLAEFVEAIGPIPLNLYSLSEAGGFPAISQPDVRKPRSCGRVAPGFQIKIADDGELLVKGPTVMHGYWQQPQAPPQIIDSEGWLHTGDLGHFDEDGYLYLIGRKAELTVLSTGHKIMPADIEAALMKSSFISRAVIFGEGRPYVSALLVPDLDTLADHIQDTASSLPEELPPEPAAEVEVVPWYWLHEEDAEPIATTAHPKVKMLLDQAVTRVNQQLDQWERIKKYSLVEQAYSPAANKIESLMPARHLIAQQFQPQIEAMYPHASHLKERKITEVTVTPERLRELLAKETILDAWMADAGIEFLFKLARDKHIDAPSMVHISDIAATIAQMENEERPLSTALIVGDPVRIGNVLPVSQIQLLRHDHIRRMRPILTNLARIVDGLVLGFMIDKHGYVRGIHKLDVPLDEPPSSFLLGPQFRRHAAISAECDALVFFVPTGGRQVRVFANGELAGRYSNGDWSPESIFRVGDTMASLIEQKNYDLPLVQRVLRCAFQMSEENLGAIFIVGNANLILENSDAPEISHFALIVSAEMSTMTDQELINFAKQDGATVIDTEGRFRGCMVLLRPAADTPAEIGPGKGARHSSAAKMSAEAQCLAITVSQDGPITVYDNGQRVLSL